MSIEIRLQMYDEFNNFLNKEKSKRVYKQKALAFLPGMKCGERIDVFIESLPIDEPHPKGFSEGFYKTSLEPALDNYGSLIYRVSTKNMQMLKQQAAA